MSSTVFLAFHRIKFLAKWTRTFFYEKRKKKDGKYLTKSFILANV